MRYFIKIDKDGNIIEQGSTKATKLERDYIIVDKLPEEPIYKYIKGEYVLDEIKALITIQAERLANYDMGLQMGALMKQANYDRLQGKELIQELDDALGHVQSVKHQIPKPNEETIDDTI